MDWKKLIEDLTDAGHKQTQIAEKCGCSQASISDLATGVTENPGWKIADALREMHRRVMRQKRRRNEVEA